MARASTVVITNRARGIGCEQLAGTVIYIGLHPSTVDLIRYLSQLSMTVQCHHGDFSLPATAAPGRGGSRLGDTGGGGGATTRPGPGCCTIVGVAEGTVTLTGTAEGMAFSVATFSLVALYRVSKRTLFQIKVMIGDMVRGVGCRGCRGCRGLRLILCRKTLFATTFPNIHIREHIANQEPNVIEIQLGSELELGLELGLGSVQPGT